jgi:hypothetical protein
MGDNIGNQYPGYDVLIIEAGAIDSTGFTDPSNVWWVPAQVQNGSGTLK